MQYNFRQVIFASFDLQNTETTSSERRVGGVERGEGRAREPGEQINTLSIEKNLRIVIQSNKDKSWNLFILFFFFSLQKLYPMMCLLKL